MRKTILFILIMIILVTSVYAWTSTDLELYVSFDNVSINQTNAINFTDDTGGHIFTYGSSGSEWGTNLTTYIKGRAITIQTLDSNCNPWYVTSSYGNIKNTAWSVNEWARIVATTNTDSLWDYWNTSVGSMIALNYMTSGLGDIQLSHSTTTCGAAASSYWATSADMKNSSWHMITVTHDGWGGVKVYNNGVKIGDFYNVSIAGLTTNQFRLGRAATTTFDEISVWNKALVQAEINTLYNAGNGLGYNETLTGGASNATLFCYNGDLCLQGYYMEGVGYGCNNLTSCNGLGCTFYPQPIYRGYCNNDTTYSNTSTLYGLLNYSSNQCVVSGDSKDYLCTQSIYNNLTNEFICNSLYLTACDYGCINYVMNINKTTFHYYDMTKTCATVNHDYVSGINLKCNQIWKDIMSYNPVGAYIMGLVSPDNCSVVAYKTIPLALCSDSWTTMYDYIRQYPNDTVYVEGQCLAQACSNECLVENLYGCSGTWQTKCILNQQTGCLEISPIINCAPRICKQGNCVYDTTTPTITTPVYTGNQTIAGIDLSGWDGNTKFFTVIITMILTAAILLGIGIYAGGSAVPVMGVLAGFMIIGEFFFFAFIHFIATWIIALIIIVGAAIGVLFVKNIFSGGGGGGG